MQYVVLLYLLKVSFSVYRSMHAVGILKYGDISWSMLCYREGDVKELERQVQEMRETVTKLQLERTELHTKVCSSPCIYIYMYVWFSPELC